nr:protein-glutamate O-methyltransferase CheR [uncultured Campylobacter sp.]
MLENANLTPAPSDAAGLNKFVEVIKNMCGVDLESKKDMIKQRLINFCQANRIPSFEALSSKVVVDRFMRQEIVNLITTNETYFYRELPQLQAAIYYAREELDSVRILCAPCSTGDEAYSLGMLAHSNLLDVNRVSIIGIDINSEAIDSCKKGVYSERSLHRLNDNQKNIYFTKRDGKYEIKREMLPRCEFSVANIFDDAIFKLGKFDIIFSRNMMIYFNEEFKLKTVERFHKILSDHGRLYVGHADLVPFTTLYKKHISNGTTYYAKA